MTSVRDGATDLYRFFDASNRLLYVGISFSAVARASQHRSEKDWWPDVARMEVEHFHSRSAALNAETHAIVDENPLHNIIHNGDVRRYGSNKQYAVTPNAKQIRPWACMYCGRGCGKSPEDAYIQVDSLDWWWVLCSECDDNPTPRYWIDASRVADVEAIDRWTDHLAHKSWFSWDSWYILIESHCNIVTAKEHAYAAIERHHRRYGMAS